MQASADQILQTLKLAGATSTLGLAAALGITRQATRQQLERLAAAGLVAYETQRGAVGRPGRLWSLTVLSQARFPDGHAQALVELIEAARREFGEEGLDRLIDHREGAAVMAYRSQLSSALSLEERLAKLVSLRTAEGYMAAWSAEPDGTFLLVENHCPICAAARICQGFCRSELKVFQDILGADVEVSRTDHILAGARRCAYRITRPS